MGIFSTFMENIGENARWNGRTHSDASWSPEKRCRDLRMQVATVEIEDRTSGNLSKLPGDPDPDPIECEGDGTLRRSVFMMSDGLPAADG